eukprot:Rmarinus@m.20638
MSFFYSAVQSPTPSRFPPSQLQPHPTPDLKDTQMREMENRIRMSMARMSELERSLNDARVAAAKLEGDQNAQDVSVVGEDVTKVMNVAVDLLMQQQKFQQENQAMWRKGLAQLEESSAAAAACAEAARSATHDTSAPPNDTSAPPRTHFPVGNHSAPSNHNLNYGSPWDRSHNYSTLGGVSVLSAPSEADVLVREARLVEREDAVRRRELALAAPAPPPTQNSGVNAAGEFQGTLVQNARALEGVVPGDTLKAHEDRLAKAEVHVINIVKQFQRKSRKFHSHQSELFCHIGEIMQRLLVWIRSTDCLESDDESDVSGIHRRKRVATKSQKVVKSLKSAAKACDREASSTTFSQSRRLCRQHRTEKSTLSSSSSSDSGGSADDDGSSESSASSDIGGGTSNSNAIQMKRNGGNWHDLSLEKLASIDLRVPIGRSTISCLELCAAVIIKARGVLKSRLTILQENMAALEGREELLNQRERELKRAHHTRMPQIDANPGIGQVTAWPAHARQDAAERALETKQIQIEEQSRHIDERMRAVAEKEKETNKRVREVEEWEKETNERDRETRKRAQEVEERAEEVRASAEALRRLRNKLLTDHPTSTEVAAFDCEVANAEPSRKHHAALPPVMRQASGAVDASPSGTGGQEDQTLTTEGVRRREQEVARREGEVETRERECVAREKEYSEWVRKVEAEHEEWHRKSDDLVRREGDLRRRVADVSEREADVVEREADLVEREAAAAAAGGGGGEGHHMDGVTVVSDESMAQREEAVSRRENTLRDRETLVSKQLQEASKRQCDVDSLASAVGKREKVLSEMEERLKQREVSLDIKEADLAKQRQSVHEKAEQLRKMEEDLKELQADLDSREEDLMAHEAELEAGEKAAELAESGLESRERQLEDALAESNSRWHAVEEKEKALAEREAAFVAREAALHEKELAVGDRESAVEARESDVEARENDVDAREDDVDARERELEGEKGEFESKLEASLAEETSLGDQRKKLEAMEADVRKKESQAERLMAEVQLKEQEAIDLARDAEEKRTQAERLMDEVEKQREELSVLSARKAEVEEKWARMQTLQDELEEKELQLVEREDGVSRREDDVANKNEEARERLEDAKELQARAQEEMSKATEALVEINQRESALIDERSSCQKAMQKALRIKEKCDAREKELDERFDRLRDDEETISRRIAEYPSLEEIDALQAEVATLREEKSEMQRTLSTLQDELLEKTTKISELECLAGETEAECEELKLSLRSLSRLKSPINMSNKSKSGSDSLLAGPEADDDKGDDNGGGDDDDDGPTLNFGNSSSDILPVAKRIDSGSDDAGNDAEDFSAEAFGRLRADNAKLAIRNKMLLKAKDTEIARLKQLWETEKQKVASLEEDIEALKTKPQALSAAGRDSGNCGEENNEASTEKLRAVEEELRMTKQQTSSLQSELTTVRNTLQHCKFKLGVSEGAVMDMTDLFQTYRTRRDAEREQPSLEAVLNLANYLGMNADHDEKLLWVAEEALTAPLPLGWSQYQGDDGVMYYHLRGSQTRQTEHPLDALFVSLFEKLSSLNADATMMMDSTQNTGRRSRVLSSSGSPNMSPRPQWDSTPRDTSSPRVLSSRASGRGGALGSSVLANSSGTGGSSGGKGSHSSVKSPRASKGKRASSNDVPPLPPSDDGKKKGSLKGWFKKKR